MNYLDTLMRQHSLQLKLTDDDTGQVRYFNVASLLDRQQLDTDYLLSILGWKNCMAEYVFEELVPQLFAQSVIIRTVHANIKELQTKLKDVLDYLQDIQK